MAADRRPLTTREKGWAKWLAQELIDAHISPNTISVFSMVFAVIGAGFLLFIADAEPLTKRLLWLGTAAAIQFRLLANMLDGMVAVGGGTQSKLGDLYNEIPDRVSDSLFFIAFGWVSDLTLGFTATAMALFVSYIRAVGAAAGAGQCFKGWMSKPQRMFLLTLCSLFYAFAPITWQGTFWRWGPSGWTLLIICIGCVFTAWTRLSHITRALKS
ncbi:MAG: CDP-alcohol phosphatidyltransferase family protein [Acidobacteria bacterium]|nr:CDP-alcohol phosphatidyltransferase family protein [Acidobacteriota bacterium]